MLADLALLPIHLQAVLASYNADRTMALKLMRKIGAQLEQNWQQTEEEVLAPVTAVSS
jgi:hypothetical protein